MENAAEWGKRERLETEKICLERENKQLRGEMRDLQEKVDSRRTRPVSTSDADGRILQQELLDRNKVMFQFLILFNNDFTFRFNLIFSSFYIYIFWFLIIIIIKIIIRVIFRK